MLTYCIIADVEPRQFSKTVANGASVHRNFHELCKNIDYNINQISNSFHVKNTYS